MNFLPPVSLARAAYAIALAIFGVQQFFAGDFIAGRAPAWPAGIPGQAVFAYTTGVLLLITAAAVLVQKKARAALVLSGIVILVWAALRNIYGLALSLDYGILLTNICKALAIGSGAFIVANSFNASGNAVLPDAAIRRLAVAGRYLIGFFLLAGGVQHFLFADFVKFLVPAWIPGALFWTYFAGIALMAAGLGLITGIKLRLASLLAGWMVFAWVLLLHIPRAVVNNDQNEWTAVGEALAVSGLLFLICAQTKKRA